ncbi:MAG: molybdenum cofactor biosynthesis protein MoaE [Longimicrobiales bacterium]
MLRASVTHEAIRVEDFLEGLASSRDGALLVFLGVVRDHHDGRRVRGLVYEAYREMAEEMLTRIAGEAKDRFGTDRIVVQHRVGALRVGEVSTAIAVATPHREEAYDASRYIIEEIKRRLPVWKLEEYVGGEARWVDGKVPPVDGKAPETSPDDGAGEEGARGRPAGAEEGGGRE